MRSVRTRILLAAGVGAILASTLTIVALLGTVASVNAQRLTDLRGTVGPALQDCARAPEVWVVHDGVYRVWAYDSAGRSANAEAPPLPEAALRADRLSTEVAGAPLWLRGYAERVAPSGACAILYAAPSTGLPRLPAVRASTIVGLFVGVAAALLATMGLAVRPLLARIRDLDAAAARVGDDGYRPVEDAGDDELARVGRTLDQAHTRILADRAALEQHLAALAHDLRTPLASLQLTLEALQDAGRPEVGEARLEVAYLEALTDNLHQARRLEGGLEVGGEVDWVVVVLRTVTRFSILGRASGVTVDGAVPDAPMIAACDPALAERALANWVHNGVIHGGSAVGVTLERTGDGFRLVVVDDGPGAPDDLGARTLGAAADPARSRQGPGLGVAIANEIAGRAGWTVAYDTDDCGLRVVVEGPLVG